MKYIKITLVILYLASIEFSCKKFIQIEPPKNSLVQKDIFKNDDSATSSMLGIYYSMESYGYASGSSESITNLCGLSADEFNNHNETFIEFYENQLTSLNPYLEQSLYFFPYKTIYTANSIIEGLNGQNGVTPPIRAQLQGEALFIRAFTYFYLINLYGTIPLQLTSDYKITEGAHQSSTSQVYLQIISDLKTAEGLLIDKYINVERTRPNLSTVQALLARTYLYTKDWNNAEKYASLVIDKTEFYNLTDIDKVFLKNSSEAIWQLIPPANGNTREGDLFILISAPTNVSLNRNFVLNAFEANDKRRLSWIASFTDANETYYYPFKYKTSNSTSSVEYSMVLRLAEQYLIRAEARAQLGNLNGAIDDLDMIRSRAGITLIKNTNPDMSRQNILAAILKERRVELFSEWGHRWFDLKRTGNADIVLTSIKPNWSSTDIFYPIPQNELDRNRNIIQNRGY